MDREGRAGLGREELLEVVIRQQQEIIERQRELIEGLERQAATQAARIADLEAVLARLGQPPKTPGNSSVPSSVGFKPNRVERRARKRRRGHDGISRRRQTPDVIVRCRPSACRGCGEALPLAGQRRVGRSQVIELPPVRPVVVEAWQYAAGCRSCGTRTTGRYPAGLEPTRTFGPGIEALLGYLHERHHVG